MRQHASSEKCCTFLKSSFDLYKLLKECFYTQLDQLTMSLSVGRDIRIHHEFYREKTLWWAKLRKGHLNKKE